jgi:ATP adenylyltransferase
MTQWKPFDLDTYIKNIQSRPCFICEMIAGNPEYRHAHEIVYEDETAIVFFNRYPVLYGYLLAAPKAHREGVTADFSLDEYLALQTIIYRVAEALRQEVPTERMYILSLGSQQGNRHVHWHIAPLPPGVPFEEQQLEALSLKRGVMDIPAAELAVLAERIQRRLRVEDREIRD